MTDRFDGCPCGTYGPCCADPDPLPDEDGAGCYDDDCYDDHHWIVVCGTCGASCGCNV
jgi:hypothetical protein